MKEEDIREAWGEVKDSDNMQHLKMTQEIIEISTKMTKINVKEIITNNKSAVLAGVAGYGKTFLMDYICHEWGSNNLWSNFELVFMLQCRKLNELLPGKKSLHAVLRDDYETVMNEFNITEFKELREKVLVIVDGVDEFADLDQIVNGKNLATSQRIFRNLLLQKDGYCVLVTGRPEASYKVKQMMSKVKSINSIQTVGFSTEQVQEFVKRYFNDESHKGYQNLLKLIERNAQIAAMCKVPILIKIISCLYMRVENIAEPKTGTELYILALVFFIESHCKIDEKCFEQYHLQLKFLEIIKSLSRVAFELLSKGKVLINIKHNSMQGLDFKQLTSSGILSQTTIAGIEYAVFPHMSLMEILVAVHMKINGLKLKDMEQSQLALAKSFYCGFEGILSRDSGDCFFNFVQSLQSVAKQKSLVKRLFSKRKRDDLLTQMCRKFGGEVAFCKYGTDVGSMDFLLCAFEHHHLTPDMIGSIKSVSFNFIGMSSLEVIHAAYMIETVVDARCVIKKMDFYENALIDSVEMGRLIRFIPHAQEVSFSFTPLSRTSVTYIANSLKDAEYKHMNMTSIRLSACSLTDELLILLSPYIPYIETVNLENNPALTHAGYVTLHKSILSVENSERKLKTLLVNSRDAHQVFELFKGVRPGMKIYDTVEMLTSYKSTSFSDYLNCI